MRSVAIDATEHRDLRVALGPVTLLDHRLGARLVGISTSLAGKLAFTVAALIGALLAACATLGPGAFLPFGPSTFAPAPSDRLKFPHSRHVAEGEVEDAMVAMIHGRALGHLLDVGTGTGVVAITAARAGARVHALDLTPALLDQALVSFAMGEEAFSRRVVTRRASLRDATVGTYEAAGFPLYTLAADGYRGYLHLETHWPGPDGNKFEGSRICGANLRKLTE